MSSSVISPGGWLTMGQVLSAPMILIGIYLLVRTHQRPDAFGQPGRRCPVMAQ